MVDRFALIPLDAAAAALDLSLPELRALLAATTGFPRLREAREHPGFMTVGAIERARLDLAHAARFRTDPTFHPDAESPYWEDRGCRVHFTDQAHTPGGVHVDVARACSKRGLGKGWWPLIDEAFDAIEAARVQMPVAVHQVKQKFGGLCIYVWAPRSQDADALYERVCAIEARSTTVCEACGAPGIRDWGPSFRTLCNDCGVSWRATFGARMAGIMQMFTGEGPDVADNSSIDDGSAAPH